MRVLLEKYGDAGVRDVSVDGLPGLGDAEDLSLRQRDLDRVLEVQRRDASVPRPLLRVGAVCQGASTVEWKDLHRRQAPHV